MYLHVTNDWVAGEYHGASELIDVDTVEPEDWPKPSGSSSMPNMLRRMPHWC